MRLKFSIGNPIRKVKGQGYSTLLQVSALAREGRGMAAKVINLNEYRKTRMVEEFAAAILESDIEDILRNSGFDPHATREYLERNRRKNLVPDPDETNNNPADSF
jgi:hypothetical protein